MSQFYVRICGDDLVFSAAHFITLSAEACERLHGHNYRVTAEVRGPLGEQHFVVDFAAVREALKSVLEELDHRVLLPSEHPFLDVKGSEAEIEVTFGRRRWVFPQADCVLLPVPNTTAEMLARYITELLVERLQARLGWQPMAVRLEVEESFGHAAGYECCEE
jgi:6-pyruvoyltetrahydropterin/6-carboxytetrahydropterin synthase